MHNDCLSQILILLLTASTAYLRMIVSRIYGISRLVHPLRAQRLIAEIHEGEFTSVASVLSLARATIEREVDAHARLRSDSGPILSAPLVLLFTREHVMCFLLRTEILLLFHCSPGSTHGRRLGACANLQGISEVGTWNGSQNEMVEEIYFTRFAPNIEQYVSVKAHKILHPLVAARSLQDVDVYGPIFRWPNAPGRLGVHVEGKWYLTFNWVEGEGAFGITLAKAVALRRIYL